MTKKWYPTTTTVAIGWTAADNEILASQAAPGSGSLTSTVAVSATEVSFAWASPNGEPNESTWPTYTASSYDYHISLNISSIGASLSLVLGDSSGSYLTAWTADLSSVNRTISDLTWSSTTGTGVKTATPTGDGHLIGASDTSRIGSTIRVNHNGT